MDRRTFLQSSAAVAGVVTLGGAAHAAESIANPSAASGYSYRLPAFKKGSRLLFQGDSITDMNWGRNQSDRNHYLGHSYVYLIAARLGVDMPEAQLDVYNRGMSGQCVSDLRNRWQKDAVDMNPDVLSIMIGTNDAGRGVKPDAFETDYRNILDTSRKAKPDVRIVLLDPFILPTGGLANKDAWTSRRATTDALGSVVAKLAKEFDAVHVKTQDIFDAAAKRVSPEHWMWDGIHPLPQGHELIARNWLDGVSARWH